MNKVREKKEEDAPETPKKSTSSKPARFPRALISVMNGSFLAQVFQAFRIAVNDELGSLEALLKQSAEVIRPGGRLVVMSYHSLEDRMVKNWLRAGDFSGEEKKDLYGNRIRPFEPESNKATQPKEEEVLKNPRARSARLRIATRT